MKILIVSILFITSLFASKESATYTQEELKIVREVMLAEARKVNNLNDISKVGMSFYATSMSKNFKGNKSKLKVEAIDIIKEAANKFHIPSVLFLSLELLKSEPNYLLELIEKVVNQYEDKGNKVFEESKNSLVKTFVVLTLERKSTKVDSVNKALEYMVLINEETPQFDLFYAFLFRSLDKDDIANEYLNKACKDAKNKSIVSYCEGQRI